MVAYEVIMFPDDDDESDCLAAPSDIVSLMFLPNKQGSKQGLDISSSSTAISPISILTTTDMYGRRFVSSWVHIRPILRNLRASSAL